MQYWARWMIGYFALALIFSNAACRHAGATPSPTTVNAPAPPAPQPSVCNVENLSRAVLLQRSVADNELRVLFIGNSLNGVFGMALGFHDRSLSARLPHPPLLLRPRRFPLNS